jgi:ribonuclease HI
VKSWTNLLCESASNKTEAFVFKREVPDGFEVLGKLQRPTTIYTDGSETEGFVGFRIFLNDRDSYRFKLPGHCGIFTAEMCTIYFACDLIESKPMGAYIILTDSLTSIEGLKWTGISYRTNDMLFRTRRSLRYLGELGYDITLMWIPSHVSVQGNERADVLELWNHCEHV